MTEKKYSVLIIDDNVVFRGSIRKSIEEELNSRFNIAEYSSGEECFEALVKIPDIVILDYNLDNEENPTAMDGIKVLQKLKELSKKTVVIMLSGQDDLQIAVESIKNGAYEYIPKSQTALVRLQNTLINVIENFKLSNNNRKYVWYHAAVLVTLIAIVFLLRR